MSVPAPHHTAEELARLGTAAYDRYVRPTLQPEDDGKFVAIEVDTGDYEVDADDYTAVMRLRARHPSAVFWLMCIGQRATYKLRRRP